MVVMTRFVGRIGVKLLNVSQFAERLGVSKSCIRRWILEGRVSIIKLGRLVRIAEAEVDRLLAEGTRPRRSGE